MAGETRPAAGRAESLQDRLSRGLLWADGAMGTMLTAHGLAPNEPPEHWNLSRPNAVAAVHAAYLGVGCDLVTTNTFGGNRLRLSTVRLDAEVAAINRAAVRIARTAGQGDYLVAGSLGPSGRFERGRRTGSVAEIRSAFEEQASHLAEAGVDLLLIETMTHLDEAYTALEATGSCPPVPVAVSLVFFEERGKRRTLDGASPHEAVQELASAAMVGCNCVAPEIAAAVLHEMQETTALPLVAQPHAGPPTALRSPDEMAKLLPALRIPRVAVLGGCCGTTPAHLQALIAAARHG